jgi:2-oxoglutarate ferredoxin oxidoreductase subunit gamma
MNAEISGKLGFTRKTVDTMTAAPTNGSAEREVIFTGIGGQGIQLMAKILAEAAVQEGKHAMLFGVYMGMMRGGPSESTVVIGDGEIQAPPIVPHCWAVVAMHPQGLDVLAQKLRPGGLLFANQTLVKAAPRADVRAAGLPATHLAEQAGSIAGASMVALGAFVGATGIVDLDSLVAAMRAALPPHRRQRADENARFLSLGAEHMRGQPAPEAPHARVV